MKTSSLRLVVIGLPGLLCLLLSSGCTSASLTRVKPWERTLLADYTMNPSRDPLGAASADHVYFSREASLGGKAVGGSGCGCN